LVDESADDDLRQTVSFSDIYPLMTPAGACLAFLRNFGEARLILPSP
jgi:hypothetical protein